MLAEFPPIVFLQQNGVEKLLGGKSHFIEISYCRLDFAGWWWGWTLGLYSGVSSKGRAVRLKPSKHDPFVIS